MSSEEYRTILEHYSGYYIYRFSTPDDILIVKMSFQDHLILQKIFIENNELVEGDRIVLEQITDFGNRIITFTEKGIEFNRNSPSINAGNYYVTYNPNERNIGVILRFLVNINIPRENNTSSTGFNLETSFFTKNSNEVIDIVANKLFYPSEEALRYTGRFIFYEYEVINIINMGIPFTVEEIRNDEIVVETDRQYLVGKHISTYHTNWCGRASSRNGQVSLGGIYIDGHNFSNTIIYYYVDYNTIIYENTWVGIVNDEEKRINYKIIFKRENISE
jgi:hypothetical protein